jgi:carbamoyltransferase
MNILGISCYFHDAADALLQEGRVVAAAEEERFTRKKHDFDFPQKAIDFCLNKGEIRANELDFVVFSRSPSPNSSDSSYPPCILFPDPTGSFERQ